MAELEHAAPLNTNVNDVLATPDVRNVSYTLFHLYFLSSLMLIFLVGNC